MDIALHQPEIPPNTGNIGRLCHCTQSRLHIVGKAAFSLDAAAVRRAGLDYWEQLDWQHHVDWQAFRKSLAPERRLLLFTRFSGHIYSECFFLPSDVLVFGSESSGLPQNIQDEIALVNPKHLLRIPVSAACRSLNLSNSVAVVLYEALRQQNFPSLEMSCSNDG